MKYFITDKATWHSIRQHAANSHYIDIPGGILVAAEFRDAHHSAKFEKHPSVQALPHPGRNATMKQHPKILASLQHLGVKSEHTVMDVSDIVSAIHPLMSLEF
jgi:hypothetical protein